jgi:indolepyruvate ferredoxin oxidoreductase
MPQREFDLESRYRLTEGEILLNGTQALVRVLFDRLRADRACGLNTAAFASGYPGSPLGGLDFIFAQTAALRAELGVEWVPGVNEDLAAASVWGSQQNNLAPLARHDGVIGLWYGKAPGVDRSGDVFRHANLHGPGRNGGVICAVGDDPQSKSSTLPSASELALADAGMAILAPGTPQEVLDLGFHAYALSRYAGCWTALKIVSSVADGFGIAEVHPGRVVPREPALEFDGVPWRFAQVPRLFLPDTIALEAELYEKRFEAVRAYTRENGLDVVAVDPPAAWLAIVSYGHPYRELREALAMLGLASDAAIRDAGIRLVRLGVIHPLDTTILERAARDVEEVLVVEDKRPFIEPLLRDLLYAADVRPRVTGKRDEAGRPLLPRDGELVAERLRPILAARLKQRLTALVEAPPRANALPATLGGPPRSASFCSGCPHNRSTLEVSGSPVGGGVGCHAMMLWLDRGAVGYTHMGGEGAQWLGRAPFTDVQHYVQDVGDGTFFHSASLAVRAAVAAGATMTFKLLYNGVVAMTGGQDPAGQLSVAQTSSMLLAEGVGRVIVVSDDPERHRAALPASVEAWERERLPEAERVLAATRGVTVLIYDQGCAAELRRLRKRGRAPERPRRLFINEAVCEGCGDCGTKSNCLSVQPVATEFGRKTRIHQASCNTDYSCLEGECPSFVSVEGGIAPLPAVPIPADIPDAACAPVPEEGWRLVITGIGGTGIVTINQLLATACFMEGYALTGLDQTGLSQKGGPVVSHLVVARETPQGSNLVAERAADVLLALDLLVATDPRHLQRASAERTTAIVSTSMVPTADMVRGKTPLAAAEPLLAVLRAQTRPAGFVALDMLARTEAVLGDAVCANVFALGAACQAGVLPVSADALERAIAINGVAVERNLAAFRAGRWAVADPLRLPADRRELNFHRHLHITKLEAAKALANELGLEHRTETGALAIRRAAELTDYQDAALARRYLEVVALAHTAESKLGESEALGLAVAEGFFHLLAVKDEYEIARLHLLADFEALLAANGRGEVRYWLQPPWLRRFGLKRKVGVPGWLARPLFRLLHALRGVRGTRFDVFGRQKLRIIERDLPYEYEMGVHEIVARLNAERLDAAVALARLSLEVRGFEDIKLAAIARYRAERSRLRALALGMA